jgi:ADP-ribose pyrophosphatase YjhB (NUDIX family)
MKEYTFENGEVNWSQLEADFMPEEDYFKAHQGLILACHDVLIKYNGGFLLIVRDNLPAKGILWPLGGRILRGVPTEESLRRKVKEECNLELENIKYLGLARQIFSTAPFGHGKGTDSFALMYSADGFGELKLDGLHKNPTIVTKDKYAEIKDELHPYVRDFMDEMF